ncbi:MAG: 2,4-dienoyl-CoA reductase-like NADH-dependent reductase (Old Yellow Enzyme family) [Paraglaciecola sp.]|jgi:2,4-dienoyl-CoA reductase-like NADH-dependent reductase (Old Yellow Enzyme family)
MMNPLSQSLTLKCGAVLPNRLAKSAMTEGLASPIGNPTPALNQLYKTWAQGGSGLLLTGNIMVDGRYLERPGNVVLEDPQQMALFKSWAQAAQCNHNHCWVQLNHPGRQCDRLVNAQPLSPSDVQLDILGNFGKPRPMLEVDIVDVIHRFVKSAELVKEAGVSGVQIHCAHGYLLSQFLSPNTNKRDDKWGGSLENRARIIRTIIQNVRQAVGSDFPISVKLNSADFQKGGFTLDECIQVASWLTEDSIDLLEISGGTYEQMSLLGVEATEVRDSTRRREAYFIEYAEHIKAKENVPVMITGGFRSRAVMQAAIAKGEVDLIGLARPLCTQTDAANQLMQQTIDQLDDYEQKLVLGKGFWGNNSPLNIIKAINGYGQVGFYYWQIIRLSKGLPPEPKLGVFRAFLRHVTNDFRLAMRRKKTLKAYT